MASKRESQVVTIKDAYVPISLSPDIGKRGDVSYTINGTVHGSRTFF